MWAIIPGAVSAVEGLDGRMTIIVRHECGVGSPETRPLPWEAVTAAADELARLRRASAKPRTVWRQAVRLRDLMNRLTA